MSADYKHWVELHREDIVRDCTRLVAIKSVRSTPEEGAPYGAGVRAVQLEAMEMCRQAGLTVTDLDGRIAYAHIGDEENFIGIAAHLDVVPEGSGWDSDPYTLTEREGYLVGRGIGDDKGPFVSALWAVKYLIEKSVPLQYGIRLIIGLDEESGMSDMKYYNERCKAPVFAFTPDACFPVCYGEKGIYSGDIVSPLLSERAMQSLQGGVAGNVVPDSATAVLTPDAAAALQAAAVGRDDIAVSCASDGVTVTSKGIARHAGMPAGGVNAIHVLLRFLLDSGVLQEAEQKAAAFLSEVSGDFTGTQFGIACDDGVFSPLTIIAGIVQLKEDQITLNVNCRYPMAITAAQIEQSIANKVIENGFSIANTTNSAPFCLSKDDPAVKLLCNIYNEITGHSEEPFVMSGGTYARHMKNAVSYGIEPYAPQDPAWVGSAHMKNEAVNKELLLQSCEIFINTLVRLQDINL